MKLLGFRVEVSPSRLFRTSIVTCSPVPFEASLFPLAFLRRKSFVLSRLMYRARRGEVEANPPPLLTLRRMPPSPRGMRCNLDYFSVHIVSISPFPLTVRRSRSHFFPSPPDRVRTLDRGAGACPCIFRPTTGFAESLPFQPILFCSPRTTFYPAYNPEVEDSYFFIPPLAIKYKVAKNPFHHSLVSVLNSAAWTPLPFMFTAFHARLFPPARRVTERLDSITAFAEIVRFSPDQPTCIPVAL